MSGPDIQTVNLCECGRPKAGNRRECHTCQSARWRRDNPERYREQARQQYAKTTPETRFETILKHRYNITPGQYFEMLDRQGGVCAICEQPPREGRRLSVDHDHDCCPEKGKSCGQCIRGLLCQNCNALIGMAAERADVLQAAIYYLDGT